MAFKALASFVAILAVLQVANGGYYPSDCGASPNLNLATF